MLLDKRRLLLLILLGVGLHSAGASAAEPTANNVAVRAGKLVAELGADSYARRESAAQELSLLGERARPALLAGLKHPDAETRLRCQRLLSIIDQQDFRRALEDFLSDTAGLKEHKLPGWPRYREAVGDGRPARSMFVKMLKSEGELIAAVDGNPKASAGRFRDRCQQMLAGRLEQQHVELGSVAALMYLASDPRMPMPINTESTLYQLCSHRDVSGQIGKDARGSVLRKLVGHWIAAGQGGYYTLRVAMQHDMAEGLTAARKIIENDDASYYKQYAILAMAKLGSQKDVALLKKLLDDTTVATKYTVNNATYETQFRDIALVAILHLAGKDPKKFGFSRIASSSQYGYSPHTIGFANDTDRRKVFQKWEAQHGTGDVPAAPK